MDARIDAWFRQYDKERYWVVAAGKQAPDEAAIAAFEETIGFRLPAAFRQFTRSSLGGLYMEVRETLWPRAKPFAVGPFWSFRYGLKVFGISAEIPEWLDLRVQFAELAHPDGLVPFLQVVGDADMWCFTPAGTIVRWSHEGGVPPEPQAGSFSDLLVAEIGELEQRLERKLRGDDRKRK